MALSKLFIYDEPCVLLADVEMEHNRTALFYPLLRRYASGGPEAATPYPYHQYAPDSDPTERCFDVAIEFAMRHGLTYMEGLLICKVYGSHRDPILRPIAHGWCRDGKGCIIDPTMHKYQASPSFMYYGVGIKKEYAREWKERMGYYGCLDGARDGVPAGVYVDPPVLWRDEPGTLLEQLSITG